MNELPLRYATLRRLLVLFDVIHQHDEPGLLDLYLGHNRFFLLWIARIWPSVYRRPFFQ
jgi:hypothetical protein